MKQKVLVIGAKGMLGQELISQFAADENYQVIGWDREDVDVTDEKNTQAKILELQPQILIYSVGYNAVDKAEENAADFELAKKLNAEAPRYLAELSKQIEATFVHYVSDYVFDGQKGEYVEDDPTHAISKYGESKLLGENMVKEVGGKYYLIRTSKLFGKPGASEASKVCFFELMLGVARKNKTLKVVDSERSCFTYVVDLANATKQLIEEKYAYGIYHLVNEGAVTWYEGLVKLFQILNITGYEILPVSPDEFPRPAKRAASSVLLNTKFPKLRSYEEALKEWIEKTNITL